MKRIPPMIDRFKMAGLTKEGRIRKLRACPFLNRCKHKNPRCPTEDYYYENNYSCGYSRALALLQYNEEQNPKLKTRVKRGRPKKNER